MKACANGCGDKARLKVWHRFLSRPLFCCSIACALQWFARHRVEEAA